MNVVYNTIGSVLSARCDEWATQSARDLVPWLVVGCLNGIIVDVLEMYFEVVIRVDVIG